MTPVPARPRIAPFGESALLVTFSEALEPEANARARALADAWEARGIGPAIPAYASTVLRFDPLARSRASTVRLARELAARAAPPAPAAARRHEIPVRYGGPDLPEVARLSGLSVGDVVALHSGRDYVAYFLGFAPGFAYLGDLDPRIRAPRLVEPRARVPGGSVAVIGGATAIYPRPSPGGWRLIGTAEVVLFDPGRDPPTLIQPGDRVRFRPE